MCELSLLDFDIAIHLMSVCVSSFIYYSIYSLQKYSGWPSFRDNEVVWDNVRVLKNSGETVSADGTHLGHNLPDRKGNRYCINLVSVAGSPA